MDAKLLVILSLIAAAIAGPITIQESDKCATQCIESTKFKYNPDTTYVYDYRVDTDSSIVGAFDDSAKTTLQTSVNIEVLSQCEFALQLRNTRLFHTDGKGSLKTADKESEFRSEIEGSPLRFSFQNGIVGHVCPDQDESVRSLNLKKGILSAFQNSMDDLTQNQNVSETDVTGICKTEYKMVSNGYYTTEVKKVKDILTCSDRLDYRTMLQLTPYKVPSDLQNLPLMKTTHECEQAVQNGGVLKSAICKESHVYRPFANGENGARTTVKQTLTYQTYRNGVSIRNGAMKTKSSLTFDHSADQPNKEQARNTVEKLLGEICETTNFDARPETPRLFSELVAAMKGLDKQDLTDLHRLLKTKTMCPINGKAYKYFHDAIPMISNSASVSLMAELITTKDATGLEATAWLTSLAFIQNPTTDMLLDVKALIDNEEVREDAMLPISSMVNNFCKNMGTCNQDNTVLSLMSSLENNIDRSCDASGKNFQLILMTLKAIGNAGHAIRTIPVLNKCLTSTSNPLEIRVAAAEAFRRMPCSVDEQNLWDTFADKDLDSELRINAYLALMRCPSESTLGKMAAMLSAEEDEQVGAFVYSHLTNLRETSDPHKQEVAEAINNLALDKEFDLSPVKYSRNFEVSGLLNKINTGVTAEANLIWSNKVQLPRAVSGNLTVQLFGQSINLLDFGGRMEGLEYLIKNIFGPYVNSEEKDSWSKIDSDNMKGSIYGRVFGNEMLFMHSQATKSLFGKKPPTFLDLLIRMANKQHIALTQSVQFLDVSMVIPTSAGFPIHVCVNGTATIDLNMSGKMDLRKVGSAPRSMNVDGEVRPSAALEITGEMSVDSFVTKTGLRMRNTLHTSTAVKGRIQLNRGQQLNVELDTPEDKMEIFDARSKFFILHDDKEIEQKMIEENRKDFKYCSSEQMTKISGMEICGQLSFPNASMKADSPYYPLTGPSAVSVTLFKRDSHSGYKLFAKRVENKKTSIAQISINTPGSQTNRAISVDMSINYKEQNVEMTMASPWKKVAVNGNVINVKDLKSLSGKLIVDDKDTYAMTGEVKVTQSKSKIQMNPMIEFRRPGADNVQVIGFIAVEKPMKSLNMEMSLSGISKLPYTVKTVVENTKKEKSLQASISLDGKNEYSIRASNVMSIMGKKYVIASIKNQLEVQSPERTLATLSSTADYREGKSLNCDSSVFIYRVLKKPVTLAVKFLKISRKRAVNYKIDLKTKSSYLTGGILCTVAKKPNGFISMTSTIGYTIPKVAKNKIILTGKFNNRSTKSLISYIIQSSMNIKKNPEYNHVMKADISHKKKLSSASMNINYGANPKDKTKKLYLLTYLTRKAATMKIANINYKLNAQAPAHNVDILLAGEHEHSPKLLDTSVTLTYAPKKHISAALTLRNKSKKLSKMNGKAFVSWPGKEYTINTDLTQKSAKQYAHTLNFKSNAGTKHTISTNYKMPKSNSHDVVTSFRLHKLKPVTISGTTNLNLKNFAASGEVKTGKDVYGFKTVSKISKAPSGKFSLELIHPERRITLAVKGDKSRSKYEGKIEADWDAGKNQNSTMSIDGSFFHKATKGFVSVGSTVNFKSPFENFENFLGSVKYGSDLSQNAATGKFLWGDKKNQIASTLSVKKPISLSNLHFDGSIKTPFKGIRSAAIDVAHKFDGGFSTVIKGDIDKESAKLSVLGKATNNGFNGNMNLKSTIKNAESVIVSASHATKGDSCTSNAEMNHNGKVYSYDLTMSHSGDGWQRKTDGNLVLKLNKQKIVTQWNHKNTDATILSKLSSKWDDKRVLFDLNGSHKLSDLRNINGVLKIKSPWKPARDIEFNVDHKHGSGLINSIAFLRQGSNKEASSVVNYNLGNNNVDFDFDIASPFHEQLNGKLNANYDSYPLTTTAELKWAPKKKATVEGSIAVPSWDDADFNLKMTTPSRTLRNVVLKASNKRQNGELLSNLNLDYGMRQNIDIESRIGNEEQNKMFRLKMKCPWDHVKSLNTGFNVNGHAYKFDANADFELLPSIKKFDGAVSLEFDPQNRNIMNGKMRLDTPLTNYPYFELSTSSVRTGALRKSYIQAEYNPQKIFSLDATYTCLKCHPVSFDAVVKTPYPEYNDIGVSFQHTMGDSSTKSQAVVKYQPGKKIEGDLNWEIDLKQGGMNGKINVKSPHPKLNDIGLTFQHNMGASSVKSQVEFKYQTDKKIEGDFNADWNSNIEGSLIVKTPFRGYESNKLSMKHRGELANFDTHTEINVAEADIVADASFKTGYTTTASFAFTSAITGLENIDASLRKKGKLSNMKAGCIIKINGEKIQTTFNNKMTKDSLKTNFDLMTPFTKAFKFGLDHSGLPESFNNKISINYGRKVDIDTIVSFDIRDNNVKGNGVVKYNVGSGRKTARVSINKSGPVEDISLATIAAFQKDEISVSASLNTKDGIDGSVNVKTPYDDFNNVALALQHNVKVLSIKSHAEIKYQPDKKIEGDFNWEFEPKQGEMNGMISLNSPYPKFNDIGLSFQHNMGASSTKCHAEIKYQPDKKIEGDFNADWTSNIDGSLIVKTPFRGYESNKISMKHRGELANFDTHGEINVAEADIVADASFKNGYTTAATFIFTSPIPGLENIDASLRKNGEMKDIKASAVININGNKIETTFNNKLTKDSLNTNLNVITPFTKAFKFDFDHSGLPESFNNKININYGHKVDIDTIVSFDISGNNVNGNGVLNYNLGKDENTVRVTIGKNGPVEDISLATVVAFNRDEISVTASLNTNDGVHGSLQVKTPFDDFKNTGMSLSHSGLISDFTTSTNINYMDNKIINGKMEFSRGNGIKLSSELTTPFKNFESTTIKINHDINAYSGDVSGKAELTTTIGEFGNGDIVYTKTGVMNNLVLKGDMSANGKNLALLKLTNKMDDSELHSMCSFKSVKTPGVFLNIDHTGDRFTFNTNTMIKIGKNIVSTEANMKQTYDSITTDSSLTYQFEGQNENKMSVSLKNTGRSYNWNMELVGKFNGEEAKLSATRTGPLESMQFGGSASYNGDSIDLNGIWKNTEKIEGTLKVITPFENFKNLGIVLSHEGELSAFSSNFNLNYMDGKNILGKVELNAYSMESIKFVSDLQTPFEHFETLSMKFNNIYDQYTSGLRGNAAIDTSIAGFGTGSIAYSKVGSLKDLTLIGTFLRNGVEVDDLKITNRHQDQELHSSFEYKSIRTNRISLTLDHSGDLSNMKTSATASLGTKNVINGETSLNQVGNTIDAEGKLFYNIENFQNNQASLTFHKEGELNDFNVVLTGKHAGDVSKITCNFKNQDELTGDLTVNTPIDGYRNIGLSFQHSGNLDRFNCEGKLMLIDNNELSGKIEFYRSLFQTIETVIELNTPITDYEFNKFEYRHEGHSDRFTCNSALQYGKSQRITYDLSATSSPNPQITVTLKMPENQVMATGSYENTWPKYAINAKLDAGVEKTIVLDGSFDASKDIAGVLTLSTPVDGFTNVGLNFKHSPKHNGLSAEGKVTYMDGKDISGKVETKMNKNMREFSVEVATPFKNFELTKYEAKHVSNKKINKLTTTLIYFNNEKMTVEASRKFKPSPEISIFVDIPLFTDTIEAFVSIPENNWPKYEINSRFNYGSLQQYTMAAAFDATKDISGSIKIVTPIADFNRIGMSFIHSGDSEKFGTEGTLTYKDEQEIFGKINFYRYMWRRIDASMELTTPFISMQNTKAEVNFEDNSNSISTTAALEYNNGQKLNGNVKITYSPNYDVLITLNTPYNDFSVIKAEGALDLTAPAYEAMCSLNYGTDKVYSANGKFNLYSAERMDGTLEVNTPLEGFEYTKAEYDHKIDSSEFESFVSLTYDDGKKMNCDIKSTLSPNFDGTVTVKTPFRGFEYMQASSTFESSYSKYEASSSLNFGQGNLYTMSSELDYSIEPMKASTKVNTPFEDFRNVELTITHEGGLTNFRTTGFLSSPLTNHVNAVASLRCDAVLDMSVAASIQSSLEGFDDLKVELKASDVAGEVKTNAVVGWTSGQQMTYEGNFRKQEGWNENKMHADVSISTPFVAIHNMNLQMDHSAQTYSYSEKMNFEMNGDSLLDFDAEYNFNDMKSGELIVRQPWPMQYTAKKSSNDGITDAEVFVNWNRDEPESNVRVHAIVTDKSDSYQTENSVDLSVAYASRKVGVVHKLSEKSSQLLSNGYIYWNTDDESKVSYDLQLNDNSRRRKQMLDGSFKLGLPSRTLGLTGSYSNNAATTITDTTFSWDADRDDSKQIGVKATVNQGNNLKGTVAVSMPSMRKEISISGEIMVNQGRVILDTKTDISYSRDSTKTLTLTSKLEDISTRNSHFNYSLVLGMKHTHTNIDIQLNSHVGSSDEAMTLGMETSYMTSKRQMKNLALLSEINMLKKQINVQFVNPMNKIEIIGDMISENPQKFRLLNKIDGVEAFRSDMTIDNKKKAFSFNTFIEADTLSFSAKYPNTSAFKMELTHHNPNFDHDEALLFVRLNTSRFLHTRLSWRPEMMEELSDYVLPEALQKTASAVLVITSTNDAVAEELSSKYAAITNEINKEMRPFINALNEELIVVAEKMNELSAELKEMYERNDYYIQNMGEKVLKLQEKMQRLSIEYKTSYSKMITSLRQSLRAMRNYPIAANYRDFVTENGKWLIKESVKSLSSLQSYMAEVDQTLKEYKASMMEMKQKAIDTIYNTSYVDYLSNHIMQVPDIEISPYISSFPLPEQYTNVINEVPAKISAKLSDILGNSEVKFVKEGLNEVYQQGVWAYNYWQIEENLEKHAESILKTLKEIVEEELKEYSEDLKMLLRNPITVWDPEHGEIQAGIPMPIDVKRLDKLPDITPIINNAEKFAITYLPDQGTWNNLVESVSDMWPAQSTNETGDGLTAQMTNYKPSKKYRKKGRKYKVNKQ